MSDFRPCVAAPLAKFCQLLCLLVMSSLLLTSGLRAQQKSEQEPAETVSAESLETLSQPAPLPPPVGVYEGLERVPEDIRRSAPFARELNELTRRAGQTGEYDIDARARAFEQSQEDLINEQSLSAMKSSNDGIGTMKPLTNAWTNVGLKGSASQGVFSSGCVAAIAINPVNTNIMYAGATSGGVWKSSDAGANWAVLTDNVLPNLTVATIAIDPKHTNTLYVGTGNGYAAVDNLTGTGLYKSEDGGGTWARIGYPTLSGTIVKVLVDPIKSNIIFAAQYSPNPALYRSTDSGVTWNKVFPSTGNSAGVVWDVLATVVNNAPYLYFVEGNNLYTGSQECGVYKSIDDGATWSKYNSFFPRGDTIGRAALAASIADPKRIFVLMVNPGGDIISNGTRDLFRSTDNGLSWSALAIPATVFHGGGSQAAQGWYDLVLGVTPFSKGVGGSDSIYIGGIQGWYDFNDGNGWIAFSWEGDHTTWPKMHVDHHSIAFNPQDPSIVYNGNDGGLFWSQNAGQQNTFSYRSNGMITGRFYHVGIDHQSTQALPWMVGAQDQGTWRYSGSGTPTIDLDGDGMQPILNSSYAAYPRYGELPNGQLYRYSSGTASYHQIGNFNDDAYWNAPFVQSIAPYGNILAYHVFYAGRDSLWRTTNDGTSWSATSGTTFGGGIRAIGLSPTSSSDIFVGTANQVQYSTDGGSTWSVKYSSAPGEVTSIVRTGQNDQFVLVSFYASGSNHLLRSTNSGTSWQTRNGSSGHTLPAVGINCVALDSVDPLRVWYAATDNGIYYTQDSGATWGIAGAGIGLAVCRDVQVQANKTTIRVATFGRGLWEGNTNTLPVELSTLAYHKTRSGTQLAWHTDSELGNQGFWVERSIDGAAFEDVSFVASRASGGVSNTRLDYDFVDTVRHSGTYLYQLKQMDLDGSMKFSNHVEVHWGNDQMIVYQNYPNPLLIGTPDPTLANGFQPFGEDNTPFVTPALATRFDYELPYDEETEGDIVSLRIFNASGKFVAFAKTPDGKDVDQLSQQGGQQSAFWNATASDGAVAPSGAYFYVIETQHSGTHIGKMMLYSN